MQEWVRPWHGWQAALSSHDCECTPNVCWTGSHEWVNSVANHILNVLRKTKQEIAGYLKPTGQQPEETLCATAEGENVMLAHKHNVSVSYLCFNPPPTENWLGSLLHSFEVHT